MWFLIVLIFLSKISFVFLPGFPRQESFLLFQSGLHPFVNLAFNIIVGGFLIFRRWLRPPEAIGFHGAFFKIFMIVFLFYLGFVTLLQALFVESTESFVMQLGSAFGVVFLVYIYAFYIPTYFSLKKFIPLIRNITVILCWMSLLELIVFPGLVFKGTRFIGIFKHIPYMVSCATIACQFLVYDFFGRRLSRSQFTIFTVHFLVCLALLILTGTRSAVFAVLVSYILAFFIFPSAHPGKKFIKVSMMVSGLIFFILFSAQIFEFATGVLTGEQSIGLRQAQNGIESRLEEVERGYEIFQKNPYLGQGLLSKFADVDESKVGQYNANKDPHNALVSAGVIGGWGLIVLTVIGFVGLVVVCLRKFFFNQTVATEQKVLVIYLATHIPILAIYHLHLSVGGLADRMYWIVIGYVMLKENSIVVPSQSTQLD